MAKKYKETHPWITFKLDLTDAKERFWLQMGEIASKCEHLAGTPLSPNVASHLNKIFLAKGVLATAAIEGNTLSEEQVLQQIDNQLELPHSQDYLKQEVKNIIDLCNDEITAMTHKEGEGSIFSKKLIKHYNEKVLAELEVNEGVIPGKFRNHSVIVGNVYRGAPPEDCDFLIDKFVEWLSSEQFVAPEENLQIPYALLKAIIGHVYLAWIHPFGDGNGRTARMIEFHALFSSGVPLPAAHLLSDHYNRTRSQYYRELDKASKSGGDLVPFIKYALQGFLDGIREQITIVRNHQMKVAWENYIYKQFRDKKQTPTQKRRRDLVLELSNYDWVPVSDITDLTPFTARAYAMAGDRMLQRDLNDIAQLGLISRRRGEVKANSQIMAAFTPVKIKNNNVS